MAAYAKVRVVPLRAEVGITGAAATGFLAAAIWGTAAPEQPWRRARLMRPVTMVFNEGMVGCAGVVGCEDLEVQLLGAISKA